MVTRPPGCDYVGIERVHQSYPWKHCTKNTPSQMFSRKRRKCNLVPNFIDWSRMLHVFKRLIMALTYTHLYHCQREMQLSNLHVSRKTYRFCLTLYIDHFVKYQLFPNTNIIFQGATISSIYDHVHLCLLLSGVAPVRGGHSDRQTDIGHTHKILS